jgi:two-component system cell cycle sensor histidine kinase/response regulator CckA
MGSEHTRTQSDVETGRTAPTDEQQPVQEKHPVGGSAITHDVSFESRTMDRLAGFAGSIAHDLNNILSVISGHTALIKEGKVPPEQMPQRIEAIHRATERATGLTRQLLTFSGRTPLLTTRVYLNDALWDMVKLLKETFPSININPLFSTDLPSIIADQHQLNVAFLHVLVNACEAMPHGGTLTMETRYASDEEVARAFAGPGNLPYICIRITDTGSGMDEETRERMFDPFFTTNKTGKGQGFGLSLVYGIVKSHHGHVSVKSELNKGTELIFLLPLSAHRASEVRPEIHQRAREGRTGATILLVEDDDMVLDLLTMILTGHGYDVLTAEDGEDALEVFAHHKDRIALVITDLMLPLIGGIELCKRMREIKPSAKVILTSGRLDPSTRSIMDELRIEAFLPKPYHPASFLKMVKEVLQSA